MWNLSWRKNKKKRGGGGGDMYVPGVKGMTCAPPQPSEEKIKEKENPT
jgi:hypothetical protein